jgi:hypothetical protein
MVSARQDVVFFKVEMEVAAYYVLEKFTSD